MECYSAIREKKGKSAICNNKDELKNIMLSEINQKEKDKYCRLSLRYAILKSQTHRNKDYNGGYHGWEVGE